MSKNRIAIIEDDKPILDMYLMKLNASGYEVKGAEDGVEGLKMLKDFQPDLVLLDLRMPRMSGQDMLKKLRQTDWGNHLLVIILTNLSLSEASLDLRYLKVEKYIIKAHSTPSQVAKEVESALIRHGKLARRKLA